MDVYQIELFNAIKNDDMRVVFQLLSHNIDLNICLENEPLSVLDYALTRLFEKTGSVEIVYELLKHGADVNFVCNDLMFPLNTALCFSATRPKLVEVLLKYGANPNTKEELSTLVTVEDEINTSKLLLDYGAQYNLDYTNGYASNNALHRAIANSNDNMIELLLDYGADPMSNEEGYMLNSSEYEEFKILLNPNNPPPQCH